MGVNYADMFHNKLIDFTDDLSSICPHLNELKLVKRTIQNEFPFTKKDIHKIFRDNVVIPFGEHIQNRDEVFFLESADYSGTPVGFDLITQIKGIWVDLSDVNKDMIWKHLLLLVKLNEKE